MSGSRNDPRKAKLRRERIRQEKHSARSGPLPPAIATASPSFASERSMRDIHALLEGQTFDNVDQINARLAELVGSGSISEIAAARKQDDPKWKAQQLAYEALDAPGPVEALRLANEALELDPDCVDAQRCTASIVPMGEGARLRMMRQIIAKAEQNLGDDFFAENTGQFWGVIETRPYLRALQYLAELLAEQRKFSEAIPVYARIIELNPNDNLGTRFPLLGLYLAVRQPELANRLMAQFPDEDQRLAGPAWARVLQHWLTGNLSQAQAALARAREVNPFAELYVSGRLPIPDEPPPMYRPGDETDADVCAVELAPAWLAYPAFQQWLQAQPPASVTPHR